MVAALGEYVKRVSRSCPIEVVEVRDAAAGLKRLDANRAAQNGWESSGIAGFAR